MGVSRIGPEEDTGGVVEDASGDGSGVAIGSDAGTEPAQARERVRLAAISSTLVCLEGLIFITRLIPLY